MPANISTRGSAESVLGLMVIATLALTMRRRYDSAAIMLGFAVHFKIYPFIYGASILASMQSNPTSANLPPPLARIAAQFTRQRIRFTLVSLTTFIILNIGMYSM